MVSIVARLAIVVVPLPGFHALDVVNLEQADHFSLKEILKGDELICWLFLRWGHGGDGWDAINQFLDQSIFLCLVEDRPCLLFNCGVFLFVLGLDFLVLYLVVGNF